MTLQLPVIKISMKELAVLFTQNTGQQAWNAFKTLAFERGLRYVRPTTSGKVEIFRFKTWVIIENGSSRVLCLQNIAESKGEDDLLKNPRTGDTYTIDEFVNRKDRPPWHG